jgi:L,D-transpeptidase catalytic domain/Putative peptidoglycan binding domain
MRRPGSPAAVVAVVVAALVATLWTAPAASADDPPVPVPTAQPTQPAAEPTQPAAEPTPPAVEPVMPVRPTPVTRASLPLRFDDRGPLVATAQERLLWLGYPLSENSQGKDLFGITMRRAVKEFQAKYWLPVSGRIDQRTWRTLKRLADPVEALPRRCTEVSKAICIDKSTRLLRYVVKGRVRMTADARFGGPGMETGEGVFRVNTKSYDHTSSLYGSWMPRAMFFNGDEAVHYSPDFVSVGYSRGSHGCVGMRDMEKATWLFGQVPVGTRVYVYWS